MKDELKRKELLEKRILATTIDYGSFYVLSAFIIWFLRDGNNELAKVQSAIFYVSHFTM